MSQEESTAARFGDVIAEHLALRAQNAALEASMPLRDYLPVDYVPPEPAPEPPPRPRRREWFDLDDAASAKWAA